MGVASHRLTLFFSASIKATRVENNAEYSYYLKYQYRWENYDKKVAYSSV